MLSTPAAAQDSSGLYAPFPEPAGADPEQTWLALAGGGTANAGALADGRFTPALAPTEPAGPSARAGLEDYEDGAGWALLAGIAIAGAAGLLVRHRMIAAILLLLGGLSGCGAQFDDAYKDRFDQAVRELDAEQARPGLPAGFAGLVAEDVFAARATERGAALGLQASMGITLIRQTFSWKRIEHRRGRYDFSAYDGFVLQAAERGIAVLPILFDPPRFRVKPVRAGRGTLPPASNAAFGRFAAILVRRYGPGGWLWRRHPDSPAVPIRSWQVWNESNLPVYWRPRPDARAYASMLAAVSRAVRSEDPRAEIVGAGLPDSRLGVPFDRYLKALLAAGAADSIDSLAIHPYARTPAGVLAAVRAVRRRLRALGHAALPIWVTELGWASGGPVSPFTVGADRQGAYVRSVTTGLIARRNRDGIRGFVYFNWRDAPPFAGGSDYWGLHSGLLERDGTRKPAFAGLRDALRTAGGTP